MSIEQRLSREDRDALSSLRARGFAVVVFTPDEMGETDPREIEAALVQCGNEILENKL